VETVQIPRTQSVPLRYPRSCLLEIDTGGRQESNYLYRFGVVFLCVGGFQEQCRVATSLGGFQTE
jgi:hypothetical protein